MQTEYQDVEVRSFTITGRKGKRLAQIWFDPDWMQVKVWDFRDRRATFDAESELETALDRALDTAQRWIKTGN
jgi:hypothetical protein